MNNLEYQDDTLHLDDELDMEQEGVEEVESSEETTTKVKRKIPFGKIFSLFVILFSIGGIVTIMFANSLLSNSNALAQGRDQGGLFSQISQLSTILNPESRQPLLGEKDGRTNFLLLGKDATGQGLTDTILVASYFYEEQKITTINIPRDFYVYDGFGSYKINSMYPFAEGRNPGSGEEFVAEFLSEELELPIHYWMSVDFNSVEAVVDTLGGIEVDVPNAFTDFQYPTDDYSGFMYPAPSFEAGYQEMDGERALIYARSRKGNNPVEASDFARSKRQSIVIEGIINKLRSESIFDNASKIRSFYDIIDQYVRTNLRLDEIVSLGQVMRNVPSEGAFNRAVLRDGDGIICSSTTEDGAYVLIYCDQSIAGRFGLSTSRNKLQNYVRNILSETENEVLYSASIGFVGNQSFDTDVAVGELTGIGLTNYLYNNAYVGIDPATPSSIEEIIVYIENDDLRDKFNDLIDDEDLDYTVRSEIPSDIVVPLGFEAVDILVWVESVNQ